jgi:hypothetical protein
MSTTLEYGFSKDMETTELGVGREAEAEAEAEA